MADGEITRITRANARAAGFKRYFTGKPCKHGHIAERQVSNGVCTVCFADICRTFRKKHPDRVRARNRRYVKANPAWKRATDKAYYEANKDRVLAVNAIWAKQNPESIRRHQKAYKRRHPETAKAYKRNRRARERGNGGRHSAADVVTINIAQRGRCAICAVKLNPSNRTVDHIVPLARGGTNDRRNLQLLCRPCNIAKSNKDPVVHMQSMGRLL